MPPEMYNAARAACGCLSNWRERVLISFVYVGQKPLSFLQWDKLGKEHFPS